MRRTQVTVLLLATVFGGAAPLLAPELPAFDSAWAQDPLWDDGQAEVSLYDAQRPQYGKIESYQAVFIVVKEDFDPKLLVKADPPYEGKQLIPVLKLNAVHSYWTGNYPYHFLASVFVRRDDPTALVKLTVGSQEWCGNTFKEVKMGGRPELHAHTYFDGEGDTTRPLDLRPGDLFEDQLPLALRVMPFAYSLESGLAVRRRVVPSLIGNNLRRPLDPLEAVIRVTGEEIVATGAGRLPAWRVSVEMGELKQTWWFDKAFPYALLKMDSSDGRAWLLKSRARKPYWKESTFRPDM